MPFTEIITPDVKQGDATKHAFQEAMKHLASIVSTAPGMKGAVSGEIVNENGIDIEASPVKIALGLEWEHSDHFSHFVAGDKFKAFGPIIQPLITAPQPQLYETDVGPSAVFGAALAEVFRISVEEEEKSSKVQLAWKKYVNAVIGNGGVNTFCGTSLNLAEKLFVGAIGYGSKEVRGATLGNADAAAARKGFEQLGASSFVVPFSKAYKFKLSSSRGSPT